MLPPPAPTSASSSLLPRTNLGVLGIESASIACSVIDFANACLSLRRLGSNKQCGDATHTTKTKRGNFQINLKLPLFCFWLYEQHLICYCSRSPRDSVGARTQNLQLRRLLLYPVELRNHPLSKRNKLCGTAFVTFSGAKVIKIYRTTKFLSTIIQILPVTGVVQQKKENLQVPLFKSLLLLI